MFAISMVFAVSIRDAANMPFLPKVWGRFGRGESGGKLEGELTGEI